MGGPSAWVHNGVQLHHDEPAESRDCVLIVRSDPISPSARWTSSVFLDEHALQRGQESPDEHAGMAGDAVRLGAKREYASASLR